MRFSVLASLSVLGAAVGPAPQQPDPIPAHVETIATFPFTAAAVAVSPSGKLFYLVAADSLVVYDSDRKTVAVVAAGNYVGISVSPTGDGIVLIRPNDSGNHGGLWTMSVNPATGRPTRAPKRVTSSAVVTMRHSPDGKRLAFMLTDRIAVVPVDSGPEQILSRAPFNASLGWSPDGKWIYATEFGAQGWVVARIPAEGGVPEPMTPMISAGAPGLSPDGQFLVVQPVTEQSSQPAAVTMLAPADVRPGSRITLATGAVAVVAANGTLRVPVGGGNIIALRAAGYSQPYEGSFAVYESGGRFVRSLSVTLAAAPVDFAWMFNGLHLAMVLPDAAPARTRLVDVDLGVRR